MTPTPTPRSTRLRRPTADSYANFVARLGLDQNMSAGAYTLNSITRNRQILDTMYLGSWIVGAAVDIYAEDMTSAGIEWTVTETPDEIEVLNTTIDEDGPVESITEWIKWARALRRQRRGHVDRLARMSRSRCPYSRPPGHPPRPDR